MDRTGGYPPPAPQAGAPPPPIEPVVNSVHRGWNASAVTQEDFLVFEVLKSQAKVFHEALQFKNGVFWGTSHGELDACQLPPACEGWGKIIFSVCSHLRGGGGYPIRWMGDTPSQVQVGGGGIPPSQVQVGLPPSQVQVRDPLPRSGWG